MWDGGECFIIGGGPSMPRQFDVPEEVIQAVMSGKRPPGAYSPYLEPIHGKHVIAINNAYQIGTWIDIVFFGDCKWHKMHQKALLEWPGLKVTCCPRFGNKHKKESEGIKFLQRGPRYCISNSREAVAWNDNSGAAAISLAAHLGVCRIILLGFDMSLGVNNTSHWHGAYGYGAFKPPFPKHLKGFPTIALHARQRGIEILNASPTSAIKCFKKVVVKDLL
jgi:hypothetical protein